MGYQATTAALYLCQISSAWISLILSVPRAGQVSTWKDRLDRVSSVSAENSDTPGRLDVGCVPLLFFILFSVKK